MTDGRAGRSVTAPTVFGRLPPWRRSCRIRPPTDIPIRAGCGCIFTDNLVDLRLIQERIDLAIPHRASGGRFDGDRATMAGWLGPPASSSRRPPIWSGWHPPPQEPADLLEHNCLLRFRARSGTAGPWKRAATGP